MVVPAPVTAVGPFMFRSATTGGFGARGLRSFARTQEAVNTTITNASRLSAHRLVPTHAFPYSLENEQAANAMATQFSGCLTQRLQHAARTARHTVQLLPREGRRVVPSLRRLPRNYPVQPEL
jgi:hypothetical protein